MKVEAIDLFSLPSTPGASRYSLLTGREPYKSGGIQVHRDVVF